MQVRNPHKDENKPAPGEAPRVTPGGELKRLRLAVGLSQRELGQAIGATTQFISNVERNVTPVPFTKVTVLAFTLKVGVDTIAVQALRSSSAWKSYNAVLELDSVTTPKQEGSA